MSLRSRLKSVIHAALRSLLVPVVNDIRLHTPLVFGPSDRLRISPTANVQNALFNLVSGTITVEDYAFFGHNVTLLTGRHDVRAGESDRQTAVPQSGCDIMIRKSAWIATNATIIGPCEIGIGAVVAAGSVVTHDVEPWTLVAGIPARVMRRIQEP